MPALGQSLLDTRVLSAQEIENIFLKADSMNLSSETSAAPRDGLSNKNSAQFSAPRGSAPVVCCLFFEPSTRTRMSFQMAAYRLGFQVLTMELSAGSSLSKGETLSDTVMNFAAMKPDVLVVRYGNSRELDELLPTLDIPVLNAGSGTMAHPTQGLLDAYTLREEWGSLKGKRVLIFGDVLHSRVARSNFDVLTKLGAEVGVFGPESMLPTKTSGGVLTEFDIKVWNSLEEALPWADACMGLRIQLERHESKSDDGGARIEANEYLANYGLTKERLRLLKPGAVILHPGPINHGVEFAPEVIEDSRSRVLQQVTNGVKIRAALLAMILGKD